MLRRPYLDNAICYIRKRILPYKRRNNKAIITPKWRGDVVILINGVQRNIARDNGLLPAHCLIYHLHIYAKLSLGCRLKTKLPYGYTSCNCVEKNMLRPPYLDNCISYIRYRTLADKRRNVIVFITSIQYNLCSLPVLLCFVRPSAKYWYDKLHYVKRELVEISPPPPLKSHIKM